MVVKATEDPPLVNGAERAVWDALSAQLGEFDFVAANQRISNHDKDHEIDFVVAIDGLGVACLEVKGGQVWHDGSTWVHSRGGRDHQIDPVRQVLNATYALREYVESDARWTQGRVPWVHLLVLPNTELTADFSLPECPRWKVVDRAQLHQLVAAVRTVLENKSHREVGSEAGEQLRMVLNGRGLPQKDLLSRALANEDAADALTTQQTVILNAIQLLPRVEIRGGAGSGKTFLALEQARRLTKANKRVALLCYSHGLASYLRRVTETWHWKERPAYVGEFHTLGREWGAAAGPAESVRSAESVRFWEEVLPAQMADLAGALDWGKRFDAVVVDEAQDFADPWWRPVVESLRDEDGGIYLFSDEAQRVFDRHGTPPLDLVPKVLDQNLRNTRQIATCFSPLANQRMRLLGGDGPEVTMVRCSPDEALDRADDEIEALINTGWRPEDLALLSTGTRHPEQVSRQLEGQRAYWDSFWDKEQVFYGHVLGFKGLERRAVVLAVNESGSRDRSRERLYVGLSRARDQLVVCGDPEYIRHVGGHECATRLGV
ncbi:ATP-binding domain-containing protein [Rhodococcus sp. BP-349]|uniref:nuclease-related domain-containing DEAD/DEAH box helicase n=1 Tax=unclassified Rhodococcus (in: high G+C Gram-positive bacteria) TaxID=192944 RepID=UPI001C9B8EB8|nr:MULTISPECIES: ATP-binding domain-containing protein [unclassified Rhodococcus (in: high G+C Gram-positive bacteria)]MBY6540049.1 ATP-binding domain-containing protein [Rhodococcus sp. BP-363]MBY6543623.1 ATP-binding domain-containing protein [Rhodococcus sp. BP-369]MBY6562853.1 ATP-binding domain-containing protein [Rhodococcus sp. BP-370]MBY6577145.1 ATP-binding domain-containing protein [Rhodococcus sp. BP-364]MBY6586446.1 ATP-binding domain-containing protein [Rhodococcus sp. BP-358]